MTSALERVHLLLGEARPLGAGRADPAQVDLEARLAEDGAERPPRGAHDAGRRGRQAGGDRGEVGDRRREIGARGVPAAEPLGDGRDDRGLVPGSRGGRGGAGGGEPARDGVLDRHHDRVAGGGAGGQRHGRTGVDQRERRQVGIDVELAGRRLVVGHDGGQGDPRERLRDAREPAVGDLDDAWIVPDRPANGARGVAGAGGPGGGEGLPEAVRVERAVGQQGQSGVGDAPHAVRIAGVPVAPPGRPWHHHPVPRTADTSRDAP